VRQEIRNNRLLETEVSHILLVRQDVPNICGIPGRAARRGKREAIKALERMKKTGITQKDVEYERQIGYDHGWNSPFHMSACYAAAALSLAQTTSVIETFLFRIQEVMDEEISATDILERCRVETGADVSRLATLGP